jgi:unsaturated chondroitin disaccharide hydrolase
VGREGANEPRYREIAIAHADTTLRNHFRPDGSSFHLVDYDPQTGAVRMKVTVQGYADGSAWARGQAWGLYGYTMMYRETRKPEYLAQAQPHRRLLHESSAPAARRFPTGTSTTAPSPTPRATPRPPPSPVRRCWNWPASSTPRRGARYRAFAERQLRSLSSPAYLAAPGENGGFLLKHATGHKPAGKEIDVPLNYADYYFLEALLRLRATLPAR